MQSFYACSARNAVAFLNPAGDVLAVNQECERSTGFAEEEIRGRPFAEVFLSAADRPICTAQLQRLHPGDPSLAWPSEAVQICRRRGGCLPVTLAFQAVWLDDRPVILAVWQRRPRRRPRPLRRVPRTAPPPLSAMVCHELRDFCQSLHFLVAAQLRSGHQWSEAQRRERLEQLLAETERMGSAMEQLLSLDGGHCSHPPRLRPVALICDKIVQIAAGTAAARIVVSLDLPASLHLDELILHPILSNLLSNALKYSPPGKPIRLQAARQGQSVVFTVADRGPGIPANEVPRIFEPFHRCSHTAHLPGSGLGLSVVRHFVERAGGTVAVHSRPGSGATFTVTLPLPAGMPDSEAVQRAAGG